MRQNSCEQTTFGYLSTLDLADEGVFGGYLLISPLGRPVEFHCTTPIRPNQVQKILYGPTLPSYLLVEQIGGTLLANSRSKPTIVVTDQNDAFSLSSRFGLPLVQLVAPIPSGEAAAPSEAGNWSSGDTALDVGGTTPPSGDQDGAAQRPTPQFDSTRHFEVRGHQFELPTDCGADRDSISALLKQLAAHVDLAEPFGRIHEAIREAQRISEREQNADARAA
jgi:hypothetical protein